MVENIDVSLRNRGPWRCTTASGLAVDDRLALRRVNLTAAQSAAWRCLSKSENEGERLYAFCARPKRYRVCVCVGDTQMDNLNYPALVPVEMPVGLTHLDSDLCWCDPIVEANEDGEHVLLHRQVTWN
jgi:hypothetical protein